MQMLNASQVVLVTGGGKIVGPATPHDTPPLRAPRPWPWYPIEP